MHKQINIKDITMNNDRSIHVVNYFNFFKKSLIKNNHSQIVWHTYKVSNIMDIAATSIIEC